MKELRQGELRLAYAEAGEGPPLVLLHGGLVDSRSWRWQLEGLAGDLRLLAWDAPGFGRSSDVPESWRMNDFADAAADWIRELGLERPHLLGLSWGSSIALEVYRRHPDLPASLILASAYAGWPGSLPPGEVKARREGALAATGLPADEMLERWGGVFSAAATPTLREEMMAIWADNAGATNPGGYRASVHSMAEADLSDILPTIRIPTLLLYGERDERSPLSVARELHDSIPGSELVVIPGVGHLASAEAPDDFNAEVRRFIRAGV
jgi:pimeloyl-ACP methyl ester carboxylesterase